MHGGSKREDGSAKPTLPVSFPFPPRQPSIASTARHVRSTHGRSYKRHELAVSSKAYGNLEHKIPRSPGQASEQAAAGLIASLTSAENAHGRPQSMRSRSNDGRPRCGPSFNVTGERPPSSARPRSRSPRNAPSATPPQVEESQQPIYVVGNAIVNPFVPISPSVQPGVRGVPSLLTLPDAALRASAGVSITPSLCTPRDAMGNEMDGTTKSAPLPPPLNLDGATSSVTSATPQQFGKDFVFCPTNADMLPRDRLADPVPGTILYVEALSSARKRSCSISTPVAPSPEKSSRAGVDALKALYNTTEDDVVDVDAEKECVAREVLSVLDHAEQRSRELAAARRHIDWDVTIPTAETIPPPAIAFLDGNGAPLPHIDVIHFTLDTANLQLQRDGEAEIARTPIAAPLSGRDRPPSSATGRVARAAAGMGGGIAEAAQSIGRMVSYDQSQGEHRIHRLVGLMGGLAEKVGLERVMEYQVHSPMPDMFIRAPYVDSDSGDLVLRMNPSLQGKLNLQITGFDCGSVDPSTGCVQTSSNSLQCAIRILYSGSGKKDPLQMVPPADPASTGREEEPSSFVFPATNPHELRYEECEGTATMYLLEHARAKRKEAEKERAEVQRVHANSNENRRWSRRHMLDDAEESQSGPTKSAGGLALDVNALNAAEDAPAAAPAGHTDDRVGKATPTPSVDLLDGLRGTESLREPVLSPFAYFVGMLQSPLSHLRLTAWQDRVNDLLDGTDEEVLQQPDRRAEFMHQVRRDLDQMLGGPNRSSGPLTAEKMNTLRCYILCLLLEDDRSGKQQYYDVIELCKVLTHGALLRTISTTSGTPEGLQKAAAAVLSQSPNAMNGMRGDAAVLGQRGAVLSEKEKKNLRLLEDALNVSMTAMHSIGAWSNAVAYATQRVHALCVLEKDTTILVSSAQRDLSELCYFFGDYGASAAVAADVLMLTEQLYDVDSAEQAEAELLLSLACLAGGEDGRGRELLTKVGGYIDRAERSFPRALRVQLRLVLSLVHEAYGVRPSKAGGATNVAGAAPVPSPAVLLDEAVGLLAEEFDVDRLTSPPPTGGADARLERTTRRTSSGKRLRWNLLSFAASLLIGRGEVVRGIATMQDVMQELVLGTHPFIESSHRAELSVMLWIGFSTWKIRSYPLDREETLPVLRDFVQRITQIKGPLHPIAARANLGLAECLECIPHSHALGIATKSLAELQRCLCCRSNYLAMAHRLCSRLYSIAQRWKPALDHANAALVIAQVNGFREEYMCDYEGRFVGALLRCPTSANVKLNTDLLITRLQERIAEMEAVYGVQADRLAVPLATLADAYYLLHNYDGALSCLQRAIRTADPKGVLFVTNTVLRPACFLSSTEEVQRRDETVNSVLTTKESLFLLAQLLFSMAAVLEAKGEAEDAQDCYGRCLALFECIGLGGCLSAIRVCGVMAKLQFTAGAFGDALGWARRARKAVHARYQNWPQEETATKVLVNVVEHRINEEERTYVTVNTHAPYSDFVELI